MSPSVCNLYVDVFNRNLLLRQEDAIHENQYSIASYRCGEDWPVFITILTYPSVKLEKI